MSLQPTALAPTPRPRHLRSVPTGPVPVRRRRRWLGGDDGMSTVEYAIGTIAAAAFAALLYAVIPSDGCRLRPCVPGPTSEK